MLVLLRLITCEGKRVKKPLLMKNRPFKEDFIDMLEGISLWVEHITHTRTFHPYGNLSEKTEADMIIDCEDRSWKLDSSEKNTEYYVKKGWEICEEDE